MTGIEYYDRSKQVPPFQGGMVCKVALGFVFVPPVVFSAVLALMLWLGWTGFFPLPIALLSAGCFVFFVLGSLVRSRQQMMYRKWLLHLGPDRIIINLGEGRDAAGLFPAAIAIPTNSVEIARGIRGVRLVKRGFASTVREHWDYLEIKPAFDPGPAIAAMNLREDFLGFTTSPRVVEVRDGMIRILWVSPFMRVKPRLERPVTFLAQFVKTELVEAPLETLPAALTPPKS